MQRQLWTLALAIYLLAITPVDVLVHAYNVRRILSGDPAPSVQISIHPISAEGALVLHPLMHSHDPIIREGVRAMLAERIGLAESHARLRAQKRWTTFQLSDRLLFDQLRSSRADWVEYCYGPRRAQAINRFHQYAYQWY